MDKTVLKWLGIVGGVGVVYWILTKDNRASAATRAMSFAPSPKDVATPSSYVQPKPAGKTADQMAKELAAQDYSQVKPAPTCQPGMIPFSSDFGKTWRCIASGSTTSTSKMCPPGYNAIPNLEPGETGFVCLPA